MHTTNVDHKQVAIRVIGGSTIFFTLVLVLVLPFVNEKAEYQKEKLMSREKITDLEAKLMAATYKACGDHAQQYRFERSKIGQGAGDVYILNCLTHSN